MLKRPLLQLAMAISFGSPHLLRDLLALISCMFLEATTISRLKCVLHWYPLILGSNYSINSTHPTLDYFALLLHLSHPQLP